MLRDLLTTWETWSARDTLTRALARVSIDQARDALTRSLADMPDVGPLDALRDAAELVALLTSWKWQAVYAARCAGATWNDVANATGVDAEQAKNAYAQAVERQEKYGELDVTRFRDAI